jgi:phosphoenolpyruvate---glycerone phosphotransferase subunit DhaL
MSSLNACPITVSTLSMWLNTFADELLLNTETLTRLDSAIGDADHGVNMQRGAEAIQSMLSANTSGTPSELFHETGDALLEGVGGAAGPLYAAFFFGLARSSQGLIELDSKQFASAFQEGVEGLSSLGRAEPGDKTMLDTVSPAAKAMIQSADSGSTISQVLAAGMKAASAGRDATEGWQARKGRASYLGPRSIGHIDPGAASIALLFDAFSCVLKHALPPGSQ